MNTAWETTQEDVAHVLRTHGIEIGLDSDRLIELYASLDTRAVEQAALWGNDMDTQTKYARQEIERQLREAGVLPASGETKFPV